MNEASTEQTTEGYNYYPFVMNSGLSVSPVKGADKTEVAYYYKGIRYGNYLEASKAWGSEFLVKHNIKPVKLGVYPFAKAKQLGVPVKSLPEWKEYSNA